MLALLIFLVVVAAVIVVVVVANKGAGAPDRAELVRTAARGLGLDTVDASTLPTTRSSILGPVAVHNVMRGVIEGRDTFLFEVDRDHAGARRSFSCALTRLDGNRPATTIIGRQMAMLLGTPPTFTVVTPADPNVARDIDVRSADPAFAAQVLSPAVSDFLSRFGGECAFEVHGAWVLCATRQLEPARVSLVLKALCAFVAAVPVAVWRGSNAA